MVGRLSFWIPDCCRHDVADVDCGHTDRGNNVAVNLSTCNSTAESLIDTVQTMLNHFNEVDYPVRVRASATAYHMLKNRIPPSISEPMDLLTRINISGLPCELDLGLIWYQAEVDYRSGKVEKLDLRKEKVG